MNLETIELIKNEILIPQPDYAAAKIHAQSIDEHLGMNCATIEASLLPLKEKAQSDGQEFWYGLDIQALQTPYCEIVEMIQFIKPKAGDRWMDLGAGYGRMGLTLGLVAPEVQFIGYEYVDARVREGQRLFSLLSLKKSELKQSDMSADSFIVEPADLYFIYDFGSKRDVYTVLEKLRERARQSSIHVVARGRGMRSWIFMDCPWLCQMNAPVPFKNWTFFKS